MFGFRSLHMQGGNDIKPSAQGIGNHARRDSDQAGVEPKLGCCFPRAETLGGKKLASF